ncbi:MAG: hypothetical protein LBP81_06535 [Treponema sp.]|jgi:hypothetical protein|nr:hypothetical protein [Treponema sp.]
MFNGADAWVTWENLSSQDKERVGGSKTYRITITGNTFTSNGKTLTKQNGTGDPSTPGVNPSTPGSGGNILLITGIPSEMAYLWQAGIYGIGIYEPGTSLTFVAGTDPNRKGDIEFSGSTQPRNSIAMVV